MHGFVNSAVYSEYRFDADTYLLNKKVPDL